MSTASIYTSLAWHGFFGIFFIIAFEFLRRKYVEIYSPLARLPGRPRPSQALFGWVWQALQFQDVQMLQLAGMDGYVYIRFMWMSFKICASCSIGAVMLLCVYGTAPGVDTVHGVDRVSMANLEQQSARLWASYIFMYIFTGIFLYIIHKEYEHFAEMRMKFYSTDRNFETLLPTQAKYTVTVENIPKAYQTSEKLRQLFERIFPGEVVFAHVALECTDLADAVKERDMAIKQLENAFATFAAYPEQGRPTIYVKNGKYSPWLSLQCSKADLQKVDSLTYWSEQHAELCKKVEQLQTEARAATYDPRTMKNVRSQLMRQQRAEQRSVRHTHSDLGASSKPVDTVEQPNLEVVESGTAISNSSLISAASVSLKNLDSEHVKAIVKGSVGNIWDKVLDVRDSVATLNNKMLDAREKLAEQLSSATGFVTFRNRRTQLVAAHVPVMCREHPTLKTSSCPTPSDIIWDNLWTHVEHTHTMEYVSAFLLYMGLFLWAGVLAFIAAVASANNFDQETFRKYLPALQNLNKAEVAILQGILPSYMMMAVMWMLGKAIKYISYYIERQKTKSEVQMRVMQWFYLYQLASVYFFVVAGSMWQILNAFIKDPAGIVTQISTDLPSVAKFFINYFIAAWLSAAPGLLIRTMHTLLLHFYQLIYPPMRITRNLLVDGPFKPENMKYGTVLPVALYVLLVVQVYWVIAPLLILLACCYFFSMYVVHKYLYAFTIAKQFESGGKFWYKLYAYSMVGLMGSTIIGIAYMAVKEGIAQAPALAPLPVIVYFAWRYTDKQFASRSYNIPFDEATKADSAEQSPGRSSEVEMSLMGGQEKADAENSVAKTFSPVFMMQPIIVMPAYKQPYPHRIDGVPLLTNSGSLNSVYCSEEVVEAPSGRWSSASCESTESEAKNPMNSSLDKMVSIRAV